ncbi:MAG TPA: hypothetical protein VMF69_04870, partial [Gemmataceae bacterium]|nr:hypothetical protein [Gemmataceae bacterium]
LALVGKQQDFMATPLPPVQGVVFEATGQFCPLLVGQSYHRNLTHRTPPRSWKLQLMLSRPIRQDFWRRPLARSASDGLRRPVASAPG